jgi:hypothetical protein
MRNLPATDGSGRKQKKFLLDSQVIPPTTFPNDLGNYRLKNDDRTV